MTSAAAQALQPEPNSVLAKEMALSLRPEAEEESLKITDQRYRQVAPLAIQRIKYLMETRDHFLKQDREKGKANRQKARDQKAQLFLDIGNQVAEKGHK